MQPKQVTAYFTNKRRPAGFHIYNPQESVWFVGLFGVEIHLLKPQMVAEKRAIFSQHYV